MAAYDGKAYVYILVIVIIGGADQHSGDSPR